MKFFKIVVLFSMISFLSADDKTTFGSLKTYSTIHSIGVEWKVSGDANHNAKSSIKYRKSGSNSSWKEALDLYRIDFKPKQATNGDTDIFNGFAGSIMFLEPSTSYEVELNAVDIDGASATKKVIITTQKDPKKPTSAHTYHVISGDGGGDGSKANPFRGIRSAQSVAKAGDIFLLHAGNYLGENYITKSGNETNYIVWQSAGDGKVVVEYIQISADYVWIEGLDFVGNETYTWGGLQPRDGAKNVVIKKNSFKNYTYAISFYNGGGEENWLICDNTIVGNRSLSDPYPESSEGEGIMLLNSGGGHTICNNTISKVADGISSPYNNTDIYGNEIFDVTDDGIELDRAYSNVRVWNNRISNVRAHAFSFQPMNRGPWYIIRNQVIAPREAVLKFDGNVPSKVLFAHNSIATWGKAFYATFPLGFDIKNNIWIALGSSAYYDPNYYLFSFLSNPLDLGVGVDYNLYDFKDRRYLFKVAGDGYSLNSFQNKTNLDRHSLEFNTDDCFESFLSSSPPPANVPFQELTLKKGCKGIDKGIPLANINDDFIGSAPDIGAYERGQTPPTYGVRLEAPTDLSFSDVTSSSVTLHWVDNSLDESGFKIYRDGVLIDITPPNTDSYIDNNLLPNKTYRYTIKSTNSN
jgi:hypothetical protein